MKKLLLLFNPIAGKAQIVNKLCDIILYYTEHGYIVTAYPTGIMICDILSEYDYDLIVCVGGDGTLSQVISGYIISECKIPLGYLPMGSTNDFAKTIGYSLILERDLSISCEGKLKLLDIGKFNDQYFVYVAAFGSLAEVSYNTPQKTKNVLGHLAYVLKGIQKITDLKDYKLKIEYNGGIIEDEFCMGLVMNSLSIGGFKNPVSDFVVLDDGLFEVLFIRMPHNLFELQAIIRDLLNQTINNESFLYLQTDFLCIDSTPINWTLDGEYGGKTEYVQIKNCKQAIKMMSNF